MERMQLKRQRDVWLKGKGHTQLADFGCRFGDTANTHFACRKDD